MHSLWGDMVNTNNKAKALVSFRNVSKPGTKDADIRDLTFIFEPKSSYGLLGARFSGRSTVLKMIYCSVLPEKGDVEVFGLNTKLEDVKIKSLVGIVPNFDSLEEDLTVSDQLKVFSYFFNVPRAVVKSRIRDLIQQLELSEVENQAIKKLSPFQKKKISIAKALIHNPSTLIIDDVTSGLNTKDQKWIWEQLISIKQTGCNLIVGSSDPLEIETLTEHSILLHLGSLVAEGKPRALIDNLIGTRVVDFECTGSEVNFYFNKLCTEYEVHVSGNRLRVYLKENQDSRALQNQITSDHILTRRPSLEDVYFKTTGQSLEGGWHKNLFQQ